MSINRVCQKFLELASLAALITLGVAHADFAVLVDNSILVESNPAFVELPPE
jgi:hypothetical protein